MYFPIHQQAAPEVSSLPMSLLWWSFLGCQHSSKKVFAACLGGALSLVEAKDLGNNINTSH
jgi:hypothetical protein